MSTTKPASAPPAVAPPLASIDQRVVLRELDETGVWWNRATFPSAGFGLVVLATMREAHAGHTYALVNAEATGVVRETLLA